ncbi:MAG: hypothetical protein J0I17_00040 ['Candidatus Kapabacteria' thiocyanatum]|nr:hypothetical protein ['Candidatus Kapabacteria' thiocyanatum]
MAKEKKNTLTSGRRAAILVSFVVCFLGVACNSREKDDYPFLERDKRYVELAAYRMLKLHLGSFNKVGFFEAVVEPKDVVCEAIYYSPDRLKMIAASITTLRRLSSGGPYQMIPLIGQRDSLNHEWKLYTWRFFTYVNAMSPKQAMDAFEDYLFGSGPESLRGRECFVFGKDSSLVFEAIGYPADDERFWSSTNLLWRKNAGGKGLYYYQALGTRPALHPKEIFPEYTLDVPDSLKQMFIREGELSRKK